MAKRKTKRDLEKELISITAQRDRLRQMVKRIANITSPVPGYLPVVMRQMDKKAVMDWLHEYFSCDYHGEGYFEGERWCVIQPDHDDFPLPYQSDVFYLVRYSNADEDGTFAADVWAATENVNAAWIGSH